MAVAEERGLLRGDGLDDGLLPERGVAARELLAKLLETATTAVANQRFQAMLDQVRLVVSERDAAQPVDQAAQFVESLGR